MRDGACIDGGWVKGASLIALDRLVLARHRRVGEIAGKTALKDAIDRC